MQIRIAWQSSGATAQQLLKSLHVDRRERRNILREARRRSKKNRRGTSSKLLYWWFVGTLSVAGAVGGVNVFERITSVTVSGNAELVIVSLVLLLCVVSAWRFFDRWESPTIMPALLQILKERDFRLCRRCSYNLRDLPDEVDGCPECGTYITRRDSLDKEEPPLLELPENLTSRIHEIVVGGNVPASEIEAAMILGRERQKFNQKKLERRIGTVLFVMMFLAFGGALVLKQIYRDLPQFIVWSMIFVPFLCIVGFSIPLLRRIYRGSITVAREELRHKGYELCFTCGKYLGDLEADVSACPLCGSPRAPMPGVLPIDDEQS